MIDFQAYFGFCSFCHFLWRRKSVEDSLNPGILLDETIKVLCEGTEKRFCATRRSAGIPFLVQVKHVTNLEVSV